MIRCVIFLAAVCVAGPSAAPGQSPDRKVIEGSYKLTFNPDGGYRLVITADIPPGGIGPLPPLPIVIDPPAPTPGPGPDPRPEPPAPGRFDLLADIVRVGLPQVFQEPGAKQRNRAVVASALRAAAALPDSDILAAARVTMRAPEDEVFFLAGEHAKAKIPRAELAAWENFFLAFEDAWDGLVSSGKISSLDDARLAMRAAADVFEGQ